MAVAHYVVRSKNGVNSYCKISGNRGSVYPELGSGTICELDTGSLRQATGLKIDEGAKLTVLYGATATSINCANGTLVVNEGAELDTATGTGSFIIAGNAKNISLSSGDGHSAQLTVKASGDVYNSTIGGTSVTVEGSINQCSITCSVNMTSGEILNSEFEGNTYSVSGGVIKNSTLSDTATLSINGSGAIENSTFNGGMYLDFSGNSSATNLTFNNVNNISINDNTAISNLTVVGGNINIASFSGGSGKQISSLTEGAKLNLTKEFNGSLTLNIGTVSGATLTSSANYSEFLGENTIKCDSISDSTVSLSHSNLETTSFSGGSISMDNAISTITTLSSGTISGKVSSVNVTTMTSGTISGDLSASVSKMYAGTISVTGSAVVTNMYDGSVSLETCSGSYIGISSENCTVNGVLIKHGAELDPEDLRNVIVFKTQFSTDHMSSTLTPTNAYLKCAPGHVWTVMEETGPVEYCDEWIIDPDTTPPQQYVFTKKEGKSSGFIDSYGYVIVGATYKYSEESSEIKEREIGFYTHPATKKTDFWGTPPIDFTAGMCILEAEMHGKKQANYFEGVGSILIF